MNWMKYRWLYLLISGSLLICGIFSMIKWGFKIGIDFTGGSLVEYRLPDGKVKSIKSGSIDQAKREEIKLNLEKEVGGSVTEIKFENVGPTVGPEMVKKTIYALVLATAAILLWVAYQFKNLKFGISIWGIGILTKSLPFLPINSPCEIYFFKFCFIFPRTIFLKRRWSCSILLAFGSINLPPIFN